MEHAGTTAVIRGREASCVPDFDGHGPLPSSRCHRSSLGGMVR
jgi:hypothetical protein